MDKYISMFYSLLGLSLHHVLHRFCRCSYAGLFGVNGTVLVDKYKQTTVTTICWRYVEIKNSFDLNHISTDVYLYTYGLSQTSFQLLQST